MGRVTAPSPEHISTGLSQECEHYACYREKTENISLGFVYSPNSATGIDKKVFKEAMDFKLMSKGQQLP